ncbi:FAD-dependent monooxygenase [Bacillus luteolus]|uniref:FAD-dependent monooxygenase n=1 Tax=Litchfieldia luteola TaxID=682179 RepID=A0ABR9QL58_9BACI|nr:FAD-dependent monooxygenase [Cytobacillus luteolus]MBE4909237.1 FAD-dependent monooxygenase [Cytobacillus luteolus]MBP1940306.1 2-polyprenyl-6-methoxyphenol hydroxylase-like FAD-dependent oxidoreductase [Cytobacillus luteolus]
MHKKAIIIGGGIAGASMALFLNRLNIETEIFEGYEERSDIGGGFQIAPNGMKVLAELGLADVVLKKGVASSEMCFLNEKGKVLAHVKQNGGEKYGIPAVNIARSTFHEILVEEVRRKEVVINYNKRLNRVVESESGVTAVFEDGTEAHGSFLIGADGVYSRTREYIVENGPKPVYTGLQNVGGFAPIEALEKNLSLYESPTYLTFGRKGFFGYCLCNKGPGEEVMWWSNIPEPRELSKKQLRALGTEDIRKELLELHKNWHSPIENIIKKSPFIFKSNIHDIDRLPNWSRNRVVLIGDAAHAMSPHAGQGASVALEDSMYLAKLLMELDIPIESIFKCFEDDRKERAEKIIKTARRNGSGKKELSKVACWFRDRFLSILLPIFAGKGQEWIHGYEIKWKRKD